MRRREELKRGALYVIGSSALFAGMGAIVKLLARDLPNEMIVFFRSAIGLLALLPWLWHRGLDLRTAHLRGHLVRGLAGVSAMYCFFYAIAHVPLAEATLYNYSTPLFVPFIAAFWLGEAMPSRVWWPIGFGLLGILLIIKPSVGGVSPDSLIGLASGLFAALAMVGIRRLTRTEPVSRIVFYFSVISTLVASVPLLWAWRTPDPALWLPLGVMGILASAAQLLLTRGYAHAPAAQVGPFTYASVVFAGLLGALLWGEVLDGWSLLGTALVVSGGVLAIRLAGRKVVSPAELAAPD